MTFAILGGNSNNEAKVGAFYCNLNNAVSNTNWNIDAVQSYLFLEQKLKILLIPRLLAKINSKQARVSNLLKARERIRQ